MLSTSCTAYCYEAWLWTRTRTRPHKRTSMECLLFRCGGSTWMMSVHCGICLILLLPDDDVANSSRVESNLLSSPWCIVVALWKAIVVAWQSSSLRILPICYFYRVCWYTSAKSSSHSHNLRQDMEFGNIFTLSGVAEQNLCMVCHCRNAIAWF